MAPSLRNGEKTCRIGGSGAAMLLAIFWLLAPPAVPTVAVAADDNPSPETGRTQIVLAKAFTLPAGAEVSPVRVADGDRIAERVSGLPGLTNTGRVTPGILWGAQPDSSGYATLRAMGVRTVINLRREFDEREGVSAAGLHYVHIPMDENDADSKAIRQAVAALMDPGCQPVYIHCAGGKGRTGTVVAAYRMELQKWSLREAKAEMQIFGVSNLIGKVREFLEGYSSKRK